MSIASWQDTLTPLSLRMLLSQLTNKLFAPQSAASLAIFRIGFGLILVWDAWRFWNNGWIEQYYLQPQFYFKYFGFGWVHPFPGDGMYVLLGIIGVSALFVMLGLFYRVAIITFAGSFSYLFLLDQTHYLNHFYMVILFAVSLCVMPAQRRWSLDAKWFANSTQQTVPAWTLWTLRAQLEIILVYAGIVKINYDWLHLEPLASWLGKYPEFPLLGDLFLQEWSVAVAAYGVIALHLIGAPLLLWRKTRLPVFCIYASFHILNHFVFNIGIFPWFTLFASLLFFAPNWPEQLWLRLTGAATAGVRETPTPVLAPQKNATRQAVLLFLVVWIGIQLLFPLRHWLYPGNVSWTEQGHRFSWQMKLRQKTAKAQFFVKDPHTQQQYTIDPQVILSRRQYRKMATRPDMILQFAHYLRDTWAVQQGIADAQVYAEVYARLNGRKPALLIDPNRDLASVERNLLAADWILPLNPSAELTDGHQNSH